MIIRFLGLKTLKDNFLKGFITKAIKYRYLTTLVISIKMWYDEYMNAWEVKSEGGYAYGEFKDMF